MSLVRNGRDGIWCFRRDQLRAGYRLRGLRIKSICGEASSLRTTLNSSKLKSLVCFPDGDILGYQAQAYIHQLIPHTCKAARLKRHKLYTKKASQGIRRSGRELTVQSHLSSNVDIRRKQKKCR